MNTDQIISTSRRTLLKGAAASLGIAAASGLSLNLLTPDSAKAMPPVLPEKWDEEIDVIVIGSGFAGLAAAIEAKQAGASVVVLEKMPVSGGNSIINGGVFAVAGSPKQEAKGIKDSPDLLLKDMLKAGLDMNHIDLVRMVAEKSKDAFEWTESLGVKYQEQITHLGGHSVPRSCSTWNGSGSAIVNKQLEKVKTLGIEVKKKTYATQIMQEPDGRVIGLKIKEGYKFPDETSGQVKYLKARKGVVLATGGFSQDIYLRSIQDPKLTSNVDSTNQPGATGEILLEALRVGATPVQISWIQLGPWTSPDEKGMGIGYVFNAMAGFVYGVMVDPATGKRFINELADRKIRADAIIKTGHPAVTLADSQGVKQVPILDKILAKGVAKKFDTLDELAAAYNIPEKTLKETVSNWNTYLKQGKDAEFDRYMQTDSKPIAVPPFYACRAWPKVHHTMGGIQINTKAQVIGLDRKPIPGLYAAGEIAGGIHGAVRLGSCAVVDCIVFGRIAGQQIAV
ncbi:MAG: flavocytochrome c [Proteobacteria bacterium]|nr:flavocytochrome c [Pseudomonadota bacterium]MBU1387040.1 flavocytochrome c [Pseudomonadota bacterium]MBU1542279.1 flavocytochrome c [Pseudomonadota bacterium]MBU2479806.1 flavocytochrome c [Pseudomonadota bacterium]